MKIRIASILFMFLTLLPIYGKSENHGAVKANFDERIELMSIICHLAGFQEYNMNLGGDYITDDAMSLHFRYLLCSEQLKLKKNEK